MEFSPVWFLRPDTIEFGKVNMISTLEKRDGW